MSTTNPSTPTPVSWFRSKARELFGLDTRSMALFRVGLGLMLIADLLKRSLAFTAHYTGQGIVPKEQIDEYLNVQPIFRLYLLSDEPAVQATLFLIQGLLAVSLTLGYRTRLVSILSFWMLVSLQRRNPFVCHTGDGLLTALMLWAMVLPLGAAYSIDQLRKPRKPPLARQHLSFATLGYCAQLVCFYFMAGWFKEQEPIWQSGEAVIEFTRIDNYVTAFGSLLAGMPGLARFFNHYTLALEEYGSILLFFPFFTPWVRMLGIVLYVSFHIGLHLAVYIGILEITSIFAVCALLPAMFWDRLLPLVPVPGVLRRAWRSSAAWCQAHARAPLPGPVSRWTRWARVAGGGVAASLMVVVLYFNHDSRDGTIDVHGVPIEVARFVRATQVAQQWLIFTDLNERPNGWYLALGQREDGEVVNLMDETIFRGIVRPERPAAYFVNHNMRRLWHLAALNRFRGLRPLLGDWLWREWNRTHELKIERVIVFMLEDLTGPGGRPPMLPVIEREADFAAPGKAAWLPFLEEINARIVAGPPPVRG